MKGHGAGVTTEKAMRNFFLFYDLIPEFFLLSLPFSSYFILLLSVHFYRKAILVALVWSRRGCTIKTMWSNERFECETLTIVWDMESSAVPPIQVDLLIFIPHTVCVLLYSNIPNL